MKKILALIIAMVMLVAMAAFAEEADASTAPEEEVQVSAAEDTEAAAGEVEEDTFRVLQRGNIGDDVSALQQKLNDLGFNAGTVDGVFGPRTENALKELQEAMGVEATGIIDSPEALSAVLAYEPAIDEATGNEEVEESEAVDEPEADAVEVPVEGDGVNLLKDADYLIEKDSNSEEIGAVNIHVDSEAVDLQSLIGKTVIASIYVNSPGERGSSVQDPENFMYDRFGAHMCLTWADSSGQLEDRTTYPATELLSQTVDGERISAAVTITPPEGYDQLVDVNMAIQSGARPAEGNDALWVLGDPRIELAAQ